MEFDTITPASDEDRRLAEAKKLILQPLHDDISPEPTDNIEVARHLAEPALANIKSDIEQDAPLVRPSKGISQNEQSEPVTRGRSFSFLFALTALIVLTAVGVAVFLILK